MKKFIIKHLCLALLLSIGCLSCAQNKSTVELKDDEKLIEFTTDRFTLPNLHVTPDGKNIIFDVLGDIYQAPIGGGKAKVLLQDNHWKRAGKLSPDGKTLAYVSDETGEFQVWTMGIDTKEKRVYPIKEAFHYSLYAYWKDEKYLLIPSKEGLRSFDINSNENGIIRSAKEEERNIMHTTNHKMTIDKRGVNAFYQFDSALWAYDLNENIDKYIGKFEENRKKTLVRVSQNGQKALYFGQSSEESNVMELKYWNLETNIIKSLYKTKDLGFSTNLDYSFDFIDDSTIVLDKEGEIVRMDIETGVYEPIPIEVEVRKIIKKPLRREPQYIRDSIITASVLRNPITQKDLDTIYFGAFGKLHGYAKTTQAITEIYPNEDRFELSPSLSPDGKYLAYTTWNDIEMGHLFVRDLERGKEYQLTKTPGRYINPAWSPDGTEIVFVSDETEARMGIPRQSGGVNTEKYHMDIHRITVFNNTIIQEQSKSGGIFRIYPFTNIPKRFYPIPVYRPNGESIMVTTRNLKKDLPILIELNLKTYEITHEKLIPFHAHEVIVSPDSKHIALIFDEQVWLDSFPHSLKMEYSENSEFISEKYHYKNGYVNNILLPKAKSVYEIAPSYLSWQDEHTLMWGSAEEVYTYDVRTGVTEKIADIKVKKPRAVPKTQYALTNARIITMNKQGEVIEKGTILVKDNRIEAVGEIADIVIPKGYKTFNLKEKTIIPGLIDVHAHYHYNSYEFNNLQEYQYLGNLAYGVTTIYDPSVNELDYRERAQLVEIGKLLGPRVFASGNTIIEETGKLGYNYTTLEDFKDAFRVVLSMRKLKTSGPIKEYGFKNSFKRNLLREASVKNNLGITAHQNKSLKAFNRIVQGYTAIEHEIASFPLQYDVIQLIAQSRVSYTPTYLVRPGITDIYIDITNKERNKLISFNGEVIYNNNYGVTYENRNTHRKTLIDRWSKTSKYEQLRALNSLNDIVDSGGKISVGGHGNPLPGIGTHWEIWFLTNGISKYKALEAATINGANKLDLQEEIGSIENRKLADMVVLNSNPLEDIFNTTDIFYTIQNGSIYDATTMNQVFPEIKKLRPWGWNSFAVLENIKNIPIK